MAEPEGLERAGVAFEETQAAGLVVAHNPAKGFDVGIPDGWDIRMNFNDPDVGEIDLLAIGPYSSGFSPSIVVASERASVRETDDYLFGIAADVIDAIRANEVVAPEIVQAPQVTLTRNSRAAAFEIYYPSDGAHQVWAVIVNESHLRAWFLVETADSVSFASYLPIFWEVVPTFEVLEPRPALVNTWNLIGVGAALAAAAAIVSVTVLVDRRRPPSPRAPVGYVVPTATAPSPAVAPPASVVSPTPVASPRFCTVCGASVRPENRYCGWCGTPTR